MCLNCGQNSYPHTVYQTQYLQQTACTDCQNTDCPVTVLAKCVFYTAGNLPNSGILTNDSLETALQKIDTQLAAVSGNYASYNIGCLGAPGSLPTEGQFVEAISAHACLTRSTLDTFLDTTLPAYQTAVDSRFDALETPGLALASLGTVVSDTHLQVLTKINAKTAALDTAISLAGVNWGQCFTVPTPPATIAGAFSLLVDQICQLKTAGVTLPVFNNVGSVLASPGASDSLEQTVIKLRDRVNLLPTFNINSLSWNSITKPSTANADLQAAMGAVLAKLDYLSQNLPAFDASFVVDLADSGNPYAGKMIHLATPINADRYVALNSGDSAPGTLLDKLVAGTGISFDTSTTPGKLTFNVTAVGSDYEVKAATADDSPGFLDQKVTGATGDNITIAAFYDAGTKKLKLAPSVNMTAFATAMLTLIQDTPALKTLFCNLTASCPSPCGAPTNAQAVVV